MSEPEPAAPGPTPTIVSRLDEVMGELPLPPYTTAEDVLFAVRAVAVHAAEEWPGGPVCRNDRAPYPCRLGPDRAPAAQPLGRAPVAVRRLTKAWLCNHKR